MTNKFEIEINIKQTSIERVVIVNGKERYRDHYVFPFFPSDKDPIRALELFLMGEQPESRGDRSGYSRNLIHAFKQFWIVGFRKFVQFVSKFFK